MTNIVITGSHLTPAQALIEQLPGGWRVHRLGSPTSPKFKRYDLWGSTWSLFKLPGLIWQTKATLQKISADIVVSFGGYPAVPVCLAAKLLNIPIVIHEQTFGVGLSSKITAKLAQKIAVSWKSSLKHFPQSKTILTGNPIRKVITSVKRRPENVLYITGGGQGSQIINQTLKPILSDLTKRFMVYHQYGKLARPAGRENYVAKSYFNSRELAKIYTRAQLVIGRAGINTVTELAYLKIPTVLIPLPYTQKKEQDVNARYLEKLGLAVVLPQNQLTPESLLEAVDRAKNLPQTRHGLGFPRARVRDAAKKLGRLVVKLSRET